MKRFIALILLLILFLISGCTQNNFEKSVKDCGTNVDCFIAAVDECGPSRLAQKFQIDFIEINLSAPVFYKMGGEENCSLEVKIGNITVEIPKYLEEIIIERGIKDSELRIMKENLILATQRIDQNCAFRKEDLVSILTDLKENKFSQKKWSKGSCSEQLLRIHNAIPFFKFGEFKCPAGTNYSGESYNFTNGKRIAIPQCYDPNQITELNCENISCKNCVDGMLFLAWLNGKPVCKGCSTDSDCVEGTHCAPQGACIEKNVLDNFDSCQLDSDDSCNEKICESCKMGTYVCIQSSKDYLNEKCIECYTDGNCKDEFSCVNYLCI